MNKLDFIKTEIIYDWTQYIPKHILFITWYMKCYAY